MLYVEDVLALLVVDPRFRKRLAKSFKDRAQPRNAGVAPTDCEVCSTRAPKEIRFCASRLVGDHGTAGLGYNPKVCHPCLVQMKAYLQYWSNWKWQMVAYVGSYAKVSVLEVDFFAQKNASPHKCFLSTLLIIHSIPQSVFIISIVQQIILTVFRLQFRTGSGLLPRTSTNVIEDMATRLCSGQLF